MKTLRAEWPAPANIHAHTTLRDTWGLPDSNYKNQQTRDQLISTLSLPNSPIWLDQVHGKKVVEAKTCNLDACADASFTSQADNVCVILTADCIPVLVCNKQGTRIGAIHAGWRGLASGILEEALNTMNISPDDTLIWLGPAIGPEKFEVGEDVYSIFTTNDHKARACFKQRPPDKWLADIHNLARLKLHRMGINNVYSTDLCTYSRDDMFYSYRRDGAKTGRMASVIWIGKQEN